MKIVYFNFKIALILLFGSGVLEANEFSLNCENLSNYGYVFENTANPRSMTPDGILISKDYSLISMDFFITDKVMELDKLILKYFRRGDHVSNLDSPQCGIIKDVLIKKNGLGYQEGIEFAREKITLEYRSWLTKTYAKIKVIPVEGCEVQAKGATNAFLNPNADRNELNKLMRFPYENCLLSNYHNNIQPVVVSSSENVKIDRGIDEFKNACVNENNKIEELKQEIARLKNQLRKKDVYQRGNPVNKKESALW